MKAKLFTRLTEDEISRYKQSLFYRELILSSYLNLDKSIEYYNEYYNQEYLNFSIIVFDESLEPMMALYAFAKAPDFTLFGMPISVVEGKIIDTERRYKAYKELIIKLNETLVSNKFGSIRFLSNDFLLAEYYSKVGEAAVDYSSYVDLSLPIETIKSNIRKSYKSLVNWGEKNLNTVLIDHDNADYNKFVEFRDFHISVAGRRTRSDKSWEFQFESIKLNEAFLILGYLEGKIVSGSLILHGHTEAYYGVGVYDRELMSKNIAVGHYNIMSSIYHAKKINLKSFHLGYINEKSLDEKETNIFKFKSGFTNTTNSYIKYTCHLNNQ